MKEKLHLIKEHAIIDGKLNGMRSKTAENKNQTIDEKVF